MCIAGIQHLDGVNSNVQLPTVVCQKIDAGDSVLPLDKITKEKVRIYVAYLLRLAAEAIT